MEEQLLSRAAQYFECRREREYWAAESVEDAMEIQSIIDLRRLGGRPAWNVFVSKAVEYMAKYEEM